MKSASSRKIASNLRFTGFLLLALSVALLLCIALYRQEAGQLELRLRDRESVRANLLAHLVRNELHPVVNDLRALADSDGLRTYLALGQPADLERAIRRAAFYSRLEPSYDQVRFLDEKGMEIVRVNQGGSVVPPEKLQNKAGRPYFQKAWALSRGQIQVSALDLNVENGKIEQPAKPMLRFSTPVFDDTGRKRGVYVINYLGQNLLNQLGGAVLAAEHRLRVLNAEGYWLKAADPAQEWSFMHADGKHLTVARTDPEFWAQLNSAPEGQVRRNGGLFTWERVTPADYARGEPNSVFADEPFLIVASEVSRLEWNERLAGLRLIFLTVTPGLLVLIVISAWFFRSRQRATETLRRNEENLAVTLNSIGDGVLATDTEGRITRLNRVAQQLTGWDRSEALGRPVAEIFHIIHEETRRPAVIPVENVLRTGEIQALANHTVLIARDGTERAIADSAAPIREPNGEIIGVVLVFRDVSEERSAELKLIAARSELDRFFTLSLDFLCISSADGYFKRVSSAVTEILGWSIEEFLAQPYITFVHPDDHAATIAEVEKQVIRGEKVLQFENRYRHKDGSWRILSWRSVPQPDGLMYASARDVTQTKHDEAEIKRLNHDLLQNATRLEAANKELEAFSYSVSHDLRAPLRHVQGYVDMLSREANEGLSDKGRRYLKTIAEAGRNMGQLIDDLLSFSRMGRADMREGAIDLEAMVLNALKAPELAANGRNIVWKTESLPKIKVQGDPAMLKQVLANLLGNAVKYSRTRDPAVIEVGCAGAEDDRVIFFVRDNGAGFDMQYAGKLFGVFQRLHRADEFEGTGIGLANVRRIISRHGGRTWAEGTPGVGATFYFTLKPATPEPLPDDKEKP